MTPFTIRCREILDQHGHDHDAALDWVIKHRDLSANAEHDEVVFRRGWSQGLRDASATTRELPKTNSEKFVTGPVSGSVRRQQPRSTISPAREEAIRRVVKSELETWITNYRLQWLHVALNEATVGDLKTVREKFSAMRSMADNQIKWLDAVIALFPKGDLTSTLPVKFYQQVRDLAEKYLGKDNV